MSTLRFTIILLVMFFGSSSKKEGVNESAEQNSDSASLKCESFNTEKPLANTVFYVVPGGKKTVSSSDLNFEESGGDDLYIEHATNSFYIIKTKYGRVVCGK